MEGAWLRTQISILSLVGRYETLFVVLARQATQAGEIDSSESIPELHKLLQIRALAIYLHNGFPFCRVKYSLNLNYLKKLTHGKDSQCIKINKVRSLINNKILTYCIKGQCLGIFDFSFFHESVFHKPLRMFRIFFSKIREDI
jgi:hypothetical protein